jgi:hypothetical protein
MSGMAGGTDKIDLLAMADDLERQAAELRKKAGEARRRSQDAEPLIDGFIDEMTDSVNGLRDVAGLPSEDVRAALTVPSGESHTR